MLWVLMLAFPFPYIATTAGWMTAELGPPAVARLRAAADGATATSPTVHAGTTLFTLIGFCGLYLVLGLLFLFLVAAEIAHGPGGASRRGDGGVHGLRSGSPSRSLMLAAYVVLDGFDFGAGALHLFVARTDDERRAGAGGDRPVLGRQRGLAAGRRRRAVRRRSRACSPSGFSGFYLAIFLVLWSLILRGIAIEFRSHVADPLWRAVLGRRLLPWRACCCPCCSAPRSATCCAGVPLDADGLVRARRCSPTSRPATPVGILDWYTVLVGVFALVALAAHGGTFLAWKTSGAVQSRSRAAALELYVVTAVLWPIVTLATARVNRGFLPSLSARPLSWLLALARARRAGRRVPGPARRAGLRRVPRFVRVSRGPVGRDGGVRVSGDAARDRRPRAFSDRGQRGRGPGGPARRRSAGSSSACRSRSSTSSWSTASTAARPSRPPTARGTRGGSRLRARSCRSRRPRWIPGSAAPSPTSAPCSAIRYPKSKSCSMYAGSKSAVCGAWNVAGM